MNYESLRGSFFSNCTDTDVFLFYFGTTNPFRLGIIPHVLARSINPTIARPVPAGSSADGVVTRPWPRFRPPFLSGVRGPRQSSPIFFLLPRTPRDEIEVRTNRVISFA